MKYKKLTIFYLLLFCICSSLGLKSQTQEVKDLFDYGLKLHEESKTDSSILTFKSILEKAKDKETLIFGSSFFNIPILYKNLGNKSEAIKWFKKIIDSNLQDNLETGGLMEPHANFKHKSSIQLGNIYTELDSLETALFWLNQADSIFRYWGFEGSSTSISKHKSRLLLKRIDILKRLNRNQDAINLIINELLNGDEDYLYLSILELYRLTSKRKLKKEYLKQIKNFEIIKTDLLNYKVKLKLFDQEYFIYFTKDYFDYDLPHYFSKVYIKEDVAITKELVLNYLKKRTFIKQ